jgi:hypothetical protein
MNGEYRTHHCPSCQFQLSRKYRLSLARVQPCPNCGAQVIRSTESVATGWFCAAYRPCWFMATLGAAAYLLSDRLRWETIRSGGSDAIQAAFGVLLLSLAAGAVLAIGLAAIAGLTAGIRFWVRHYEADIRDFDQKGNPGRFSNAALWIGLGVAAAVPTLGRTVEVSLSPDEFSGLGGILLGVMLLGIPVVGVCFGLAGFKRDRARWKAVAGMVLSISALAYWGFAIWSALPGKP